MIPYPYNMVDMGGIDLAEANGTVVEGLYAKIVEAVNACGDVVLYNWKFAGIEIAPQHTQILLGVGILTINTLIQVTEQDVVTVLGIAPPILPVEPLNVSENGVYTATPPASGFNPVNVTVPSEVLVPLSVTKNGEYDPSDYDADGFNEVSVNVSETPLSYTIPVMQLTNSAGDHQLSLNSSYQHALIGIIARGNYSAAYTPVYEESLDNGSLGVDQKLYVYKINPSDGFSFSSDNQRVNAWIIYTNRDFDLQVDAVKATAVAGQNVRYILQNLVGNYFCLIYNSWTSEATSASMTPSPIAIGSNYALRYTYALISSPI